jgi:signal transduction histidine kinase
MEMMQGMWHRRLGGRGPADEEGLRRARVMVVAGLACGMFCAVVTTEAVLARNWWMLGFASVVGLLALAGAVVARKGRVRAAAALGGAVVVLGSVAVVLLEGTQAVRLGILLPGVIFVGFALRPWLALVHAGFLVVLVTAASYTQRAGLGLLPLAPSQRPLWLDVGLQIVVSTSLVVAFTRGFRRLLARRSERARGLEAVLRELSDVQKRLEHLVEVRSAELARAADDLETFVAVIAHDLKAPLRHLQGFIEWCMDNTGLPARTRALLCEAQQAAVVMTERVERIVDRERQRAQHQGRAD